MLVISSSSFLILAFVIVQHYLEHDFQEEFDHLVRFLYRVDKKGTNKKIELILYYQSAFCEIFSVRLMHSERMKASYIKIF